MAIGNRQRGTRRGMTLVELLVVVGIATILLAAALPMLRPALQDRKLREAARQVNAYFVSAQARAAERGRPAGVWIERNTGQGEEGAWQSVQLFQAEVPPPYVGDVLNARAVASYNEDEQRWEVAFTGSQMLTNSRMIVGSNETFYIKFDYQGRLYGCRRVVNDPDNPLADVFVLISGGTPSSSARNWSRFQIYLNPQRSGVSPLQLPSGVVLDLSVSGMGASGRHFEALNSDDTSPVIIMFSPRGSLHRYYVRGSETHPLGSVHLLVGRNHQVNPTNRLFYDSEDEKANLRDFSNFWISIGHRTGAVTSSENHPVDSTNVDDAVSEARTFARTSQTLGGR